MRTANQLVPIPSAPLRVRHLRVCPAPERHSVNDVVRSPMARREFERAVLPCITRLRARALRLTKSAAGADDLLQETLLRAWRFWPRYRDQDHCRAWLQRILTNTFCSICRSSARRRALLAQLTIERAVDEALEHAQQPLLDAAPELTGDDGLAASLAALKPEQRRILCLIDVNQRSYREAAEELECPIGTVMSRLHRARAALRLQLEARAPVRLT